jgi:hypothetical protein
MMMVALTVFGCEAGNASTPDAAIRSPVDSGTQLSQLDFCQASAEILCGAWAECCASSATREAKQEAYDSCFSAAYYYDIDCIPTLPALLELQRYDGQRAEACLAELSASFDVNQCLVSENAFESGPACRDVLIPDRGPRRCGRPGSCPSGLPGEPCAAPGTSCRASTCIDGQCRGQVEVASFCGLMEEIWVWRYIEAQDSKPAQ